MNSIIEIRAEARLKNWSDLIAECQNSGETIREWCREHNISSRTYYYWLKKVRLRTIETMPERSSGMTLAKEKNEPLAFKPLEVSAASQSAETAVTLHLPNATLEVVRGADRATIEAVLLALKSIC